MQPVPPLEEVGFLAARGNKNFSELYRGWSLCKWVVVHQERRSVRSVRVPRGSLSLSPLRSENWFVVTVKGLASYAKLLNSILVIVVEKHRGMDGGRHERLGNVPRLFCTIMRARTILFF